MTMTPMRAIRAKCLDCSSQQPSEVRKCTITQCPLWPYRLGKRPSTVARQHAKKKGTKENATAD